VGTTSSVPIDPIDPPPGPETTSPLAQSGAAAETGHEHGVARESRTVLRAVGDIEGRPARDLLARIRDAVAENPSVVVDLREVSYFSSDGLSMIVRSIRAARAADCDLTVLVAADSAAHRAITVAGLGGMRSIEVVESAPAPPPPHPDADR
jgi:anti-anti-sigma factor